MTTNTSKNWHVGDWSPLGWLETGIKALAFVFAFIALVNALSAAPADLAGNDVIQVIILGIVALALTFAIFDRYLEREIIAMAFVVVNVAAHWGMVYAMTRTPGPGSLLMLFCLLMLLGDLVKIGFLTRTAFTVRGLPTRVLVGLTSSFVVAYLLVLILEVV